MGSEKRVEYIPSAYSQLMPGFQEAIKTLEHAAGTETRMGELLDGHGDHVGAQTCAVHAQGYRHSVEVLRDHLGRLRAAAVAESMLVQIVYGHVDPEGVA